MRRKNAGGGPKDNGTGAFLSYKLLATGTLSVKAKKIDRKGEKRGWLALEQNDQRKDPLEKADAKETRAEDRPLSFIRLTKKQS